MSYPYPEDRTREKRNKGEQPYKDAREEMRESEAALQTEAEAYGEAHQRDLTDEELRERLEAEATASMREVGRERLGEG
ncbi:MAG: hypothetical protein IT338_09990 [Thermomicrobiales bacterium]|nr:hypothetical protein [Thermomicrobiales bacterium]